MQSIRFLRVQGILRDTGQYSPKTGFETGKVPSCYSDISHEHAPCGYSLVLLDESGGKSWEGTPTLKGGFCGMPGTWSLSGYIPLLHTPGFYEIRHYNYTVYRSPISADAPVVKITEWDADEKQCYIAWDTGNHDQVCSVACMVGNRTYPLLLNSRDRSLRFDLNKVPGPAEGRISIRVSDGCRSGVTTSEPFRIAAKPPQVVIHSPASGTYFDATQPVSLDGIARDAAGQPLPLTGLHWYINDQPVSSGRSQAVISSLLPGKYRIRLVYRDSTGTYATATDFTVNDLLPWEQEWKAFFPADAAHTG